MKRRYTNLSPFHGKPHTVQRVDESGEISFVIRPREFTPFGAKLADRTALPLALVGTIVAITCLSRIPFLPAPPNWLGVLLFLGIFPALYGLTRWALKTEWKIIITADQLIYKAWDEEKIFDRQLDHKFRLIPHDEARLEKEKIEQEIREEIQQQQQKRKRNSKAPKTYMERAYFGKSYHISYDYLGQRNDIGTVYGQKEALALVARLKVCDDVMNGKDKKGDGTALKPQDEWGDQPGDIE